MNWLQAQPSAELVRHRFSQRVVPPTNARVGQPMVVAEAPGRREDEEGVVLHPEADAGGLFTRLLQRVGVQRESLTLTNCVWQRPPGNELYDENGFPMHYTREAVEYWKPYLHAFIEAMRPPVIIGLGRTALEVLTGHTDIGLTRGYVHEARISLAGTEPCECVKEGKLDPDCFLCGGEGTLEGWDRLDLHIPATFTYHPQFLNYGNKHLSGVFIRDVLAGLEVGKEALVRPWRPQRLNVTPQPSEAAFKAFCEDYDPQRHKLTYDIENPESRAANEDELLEGKKEISYEIDRMSFCYDSSVGGYSVPFVEPFIGMAKQLLASSGSKRGHNCRLHDRPRLESHGFTIRGREYDTIDMWRHLHRTLPASLAFIAPFYLNIGPWKHMAHSQPEFYSAMDAIIQHEVAEGMERELRASGQWEVYEEHVVDVLSVTTQMARNGLPYDAEKAKEFELELEEKARTRLLRLQELVPEHIKPVKQKKGLKKQPKDTAGYVQRNFEVTFGELAKAEKLATFSGDMLLALEDTDIVTIKRWCLLEPFNPNSHLQKKALIKHFGHKLKSDRKTKKESADDHTLKSLITTYIESEKPQDKVAVECYQLIRECVAISKVLGTYVKGWRPGPDGLIHATPGIWGDMFRISWRRPNLAATVADKKEVQIAAGFRKCIAVPADQIIIESDWRSQEAVLLAHYADDSDYMRLATLGLNAYMASHLLGRPADLSWSDADLGTYLKEIKHNPANTKIYDDAKHTIYLVQNGGTPFLISEMYELTRARAQYLYDFYFDLFPKIRAFQEKTIATAHANCKLVNAWGYRLPVWDAYTWNQKRFDKLRQLWVRHKTEPNGRFTKTEQEWIERITAIWPDMESLCYDLGTEAKGALAFFPRDSGSAMLKDALLALERERGFASHGYGRACAHDSILAIAPLREAEWVAEALREAQERPVARLNGLIIRVDQAFGRSWDKKAMTGNLPAMVTA